MEPNEAEKLVREGILIRSQDIALAKAFLLNLPRDAQYRFDSVVSQFSKIRGFNPPRQLLLRPEVDQASLAQVCGDLVARFALAEAIWDLVYRGVLMHRGQITQLPTHVQWTTIISGSGQSGGWSFDDYSTYIPVDFSFTPSHRKAVDDEILTDPDLFVLNAGIEGADLEVIEAIQDSLRCFRHGLFRASAIMLGKAMEGAWMELGIAFANAMKTAAEQTAVKLVEIMSDDTPLAKKLTEMQKIYTNRKDLVGPILKSADVRVGDLDSILVWSEVLRDTRNAIHFGAKPAVINSYEKVAVLILAGSKNLSTLYRVKRVAEIQIAK